MIIHCEICSLAEAGDDSRIHIGPHTRIAEAKELSLPLSRGMFESYDKVRGIPAPFQGAESWKEFRCPRCNRMPFVFLPDQLSGYLKQGGPDRILTDDGWYDLSIEDNDDNGLTGLNSDDPPCESCPKCGKLATEFKSGTGFSGHKRFCKGIKE